MYFEVVRHHLQNQHALCKQATYDKKLISVATSQTSPRYLPWNSRYVFANTHQIPDFHFSPRFYVLRNHPKKKHSKSLCEWTTCVCPFFLNYHMKKHRRGLMHTSFSISSHMFTYIIDMYVWFSVYWFSVYITSILVAAEIAKENHILKVTFWVYCTRLAPFCRTFIIEKHQRRLMHVSYCISSHIFAYKNHINTLWFRMVIPSLAAAEIETAKNLLKVNSWTN